MEPKLYRPIRSNWLTQGFNENAACVATNASGRVIWPYKVLPGLFPSLCPINSTKLYPLLGLKGHNGYDLACWRSEPVFHSGEFDGWTRSEIDNQGGIGVDVVSNKPLVECTEGCPLGTIHYIKLRNWHLLKVIGFDGKQIRMGDIIGLGDSTGVSSGDHVHWGPKWCDEKGNGIHTDNGFYGAFDPHLFYENEFVLDVLKVKAEALTVIDLLKKLIFELSKFLQGLKGR